MLSATVFFSFLSIASVDSLGLRRVNPKGDDASIVIDKERHLQWCWTDGVPPPQKYHPVYAAGWTNGYCELNDDCNSPGYDTQLECCNDAYNGQESGACVGDLPNPPTKSPSSAPTGSPITADGTAGFWYADYDTAWTVAGCKNTLPLPYANVDDRPNYPTQLECCNAAYGGQGSGACLGGLPSPPTAAPSSAPSKSPTPPAPSGGLTTSSAPTGSPITADGTAGFWYADYDTAWTIAGCKNTLPLPYANVADRPNYPTQLECCEAAYGGQASNACINGISP
jgi:hypothetical protein